MTVVNPWALALPLVRTDEVIGTLAQGFRELSLASGAEFHFDQSEPDITKRLTRHLQTLLPLTLITGYWDFEISQVAKDMSDSRRLDISYSTVWEGKQNVRLIFECKKLYASSDTRAQQYRRRYLDQGIYRFVTGSYAPEEPVGFMIGFVDAIGKGAVPALVSSLSKGTTAVILGLREYSVGRHWLAPPNYFAANASFETCHLRAEPFPEITLYHLEFDFPKLGKAKPK